ncbi:MAG: FGGY family carbohydrate kinase [Daejeonella sp.]|uniref:FGGY-family carbohydrate kinase n=1 Tax=Daejeonella sp. TaxID=2805397 RepID=UPI003C747BCB
MKVPVIAIFDIGKTNKKLFLFDEHYQIVYEKTDSFPETLDEDGEACENLDSLHLFVFDSLNEVLKIEKFSIEAINFSAYGASMVYLDEDYKPLTPLYSYLKPYPETLEMQFHSTYGSREQIMLETASPALGSLNSGLQLYRLKYEKPDIFVKLRYALHLPEYVSFLISGVCYSGLTSIGCHTWLWEFKKHDYHSWVYDENLQTKLAPIHSSEEISLGTFNGRTYKIGGGLHDSSAALIPYMVNFSEPFVLISTGTWCISLNPFNDAPLTPQELKNNCLSHLSFRGKSVKASRMFAGFEHDQQVKRIADYFKVNSILFKTLEFDSEIIAKLEAEGHQKYPSLNPDPLPKVSAFQQRELADFENAAIAYHQLIADLIHLQYTSTQQIISGTVTKKIFVDGGFSKNVIYMNLLAAKFKDMEVYAATMAQASALGAALAIHKHWNTKALANDIIDLKYYSVNKINRL